MRKAILILLVCFCYLSSVAQDSIPKQLNLMVSYSIGFQTLSLNGIENRAYNQIRQNMPSDGSINDVSFPLTIANRISFAGSIFKNKKWLLALNAVWGSNNLTSKSNAIDSNGNFYNSTAKTNFDFLYVGYSLSREIDLKKWGTLAPFISFYVNGKTQYEIDIDYEINNGNTNEVLKSGAHPKNSGNPYRYGSPFLLWFFDNPQLGFNYRAKLFKRTFLNFSYSYWFANSYLNELYSLSDYLFVPRGNRITTKEQPNHQDLYSHNLSLGLTFRLLK